MVDETVSLVCVIALSNSYGIDASLQYIADDLYELWADSSIDKERGAVAL